MSEAALLRKLQRANSVCGERDFRVAPSAVSPRQYVEDQQDRDRTHLAAELLKISAEGLFAEEGKDWETVLLEVARAAVAAAAVIYPELPEDGDGPA